MCLTNELTRRVINYFRLQLDLSSYTSRERDAMEDRDLMARSRTHLEELVAKLQEEKVGAEEKLKTQEQRCESVATLPDLQIGKINKFVEIYLICAESEILFSSLFVFN